MTSYYTHDHRLHTDLLAARYLDAMESGDDAVQAEIWRLAETRPDLETALEELLEGLAEEDAARDAGA